MLEIRLRWALRRIAFLRKSLQVLLYLFYAKFHNRQEQDRLDKTARDNKRQDCLFSQRVSRKNDLYCMFPENKSGSNNDMSTIGITNRHNNKPAKSRSGFRKKASIKAAFI